MPRSPAPTSSAPGSRPRSRSASAARSTSCRCIADEGHEPFDLFFLDADKPGNPDYLEWSLKLSHPGSVIIADNVVRDGAVADAASTDPNVLGVRRFTELAAAQPPPHRHRHPDRRRKRLRRLRHRPRHVTRKWTDWPPLQRSPASQSSSCLRRSSRPGCCSRVSPVRSCSSPAFGCLPAPSRCNRELKPRGLAATPDRATAKAGL